MNKITLLIGCCCFMLRGVAQLASTVPAQPTKGWTSLTIGLAVPTQQYGSMEPSNNDAGLARLGVSAKMDIAIGFTPKAGLMVSLIGFSNGINEDVLLGAAANAPEHRISTSSWKAGAVMAGLYGQTILAERRPSFFGKVQGGYGITRSPSIDMMAKSGGTTLLITQQMGSSTAWVFDAGCGVNVPLGKTYLLNVGVDYIFMTSDFKEVYASQSLTTGTQRSGKSGYGNFRMSMSNLLFQVGIAWRTN